MNHTIHSPFCLYLGAMKKLIAFPISLFILVQLFGQIHVADEPLHHVIHEDEDIRILEIIALPGDTALMHQHNFNYCYIALQGGKLWLEDEGKENREVNLPTHYCGGKFDLQNNPFVHRFSNIDDHEIRFFTIEHKGKSSTAIRPTTRRKDMVLENDLFLVRTMKITPLSSVTLSHQGKTILLNLSLDPLLFSGDKEVPYWQSFGGLDKLHLSNMSKTDISIAIFEIY